jgi:transposase-like protein
LTAPSRIRDEGDFVMAYGKRVDWSTRRAQVEELVMRHERERITYKQLATESGLQLPTLYAWTRRLQRETAASAPSAVPGSRSSFIELNAAVGMHDSDLRGGVELVMPAGLRIRIDANFHEATVKRLLAMLGA